MITLHDFQNFVKKNSIKEEFTIHNNLCFGIHCYDCPIKTDCYKNGSILVPNEVLNKRISNILKKYKIKEILK